MLYFNHRNNVTLEFCKEAVELKHTCYNFTSCDRMPQKYDISYSSFTGGMGIVAGKCGEYRPQLAEKYMSTACRK